MRVTRRVVHYLVAVLGERLYGVRILIHPVAYEEKRRIDPIAIQNVNKPLRVLIPPCRVKRQRHDLITALHAVNRELSRCRRRSDYCGTVHRPEYQQNGKRKGRCGQKPFVLTDKASYVNQAHHPFGYNLCIGGSHYYNGAKILKILKKS